MRSLRRRLLLTALGLVACSRGNDRAPGDNVDTVLVFSATPEPVGSVSFTPEVEVVMGAAKLSAVNEGAPSIAASHVLLALLSTPDNSGIAALRLLGTDLKSFETALRALPSQRSAASSSRDLPFARDYEKALESAMHEAVDQKRREMTAADLLVGVVATAEGPLAEILRAQKLSIAGVRAAARSSSGGA